MDEKEEIALDRKIMKSTHKQSVKNYGACSKAFRLEYKHTSDWDCYHQLYFNLEDDTIGVLTGRAMINPTKASRYYAGGDKSCLITFEAKEMLVFLEEAIAEIKKMQQKEIKQ